MRLTDHDRYLELVADFDSIRKMETLLKSAPNKGRTIYLEISSTRFAIPDADAINFKGGVLPILRQIRDRIDSTLTAIGVDPKR